jgi:germination protein M
VSRPLPGEAPVVKSNRLWVACTAGAAIVAFALPSAEAPLSTTSVVVYLVRSEHVSPVRRVVGPTPAVARAALAALMRGPTRAERRAGYSSAVPAGTGLRGIVLSGGIATLDLTRRFESGGGSLSMLLRVAQVVYTATQFPAVRGVAFRLDGRPVRAVGGEGVVVSPSVGRGQFEGQAPMILVERPLPGDAVGSTVRVSGTANVFEAQLVVDVRAAGGALLARRLVTATAGAGTRGSFDVSIRLPHGSRARTVVAYARSPKDGRPIAVVRIPVG